MHQHLNPPDKLYCGFSVTNLIGYVNTQTIIGEKHN